MTMQFTFFRMEVRIGTSFYNSSADQFKNRLIIPIMIFLVNLQTPALSLLLGEKLLTDFIPVLLMAESKPGTYRDRPERHLFVNYSRLLVE